MKKTINVAVVGKGAIGRTLQHPYPFWVTATKTCPLK